MLMDCQGISYQKTSSQFHIMPVYDKKFASISNNFGLGHVHIARKVWHSNIQINAVYCCCHLCVVEVVTKSLTHFMLEIQIKV